MVAANHIAIVLHDFSTGGSERIAIRLANRWAVSGRRVTLICGTECGGLRSLVGPGVDVEVCQPETIRSPWSRIQLGWRMTRLVLSLTPDVVFSPGNFHLIILAFLARQSFVQRPIFVSKLSNPVRRAGLRKRLEWIADAVIRLAAAPVDALITMSPSLGREAKLVFAGMVIAEIAEPILEDGVGQMERHSGAHDEVVILCAARLAPQKNLLLAIRAFAALPRELKVRLIIVGEGPLRHMLEQEAIRLGVADKIEMPGHVADIAPYLALADLYLMTSRYEGYPAVLIEAMAAGVRIVTTDCSQALSEILLAPSLGKVVSSADPETVAAAIISQLKGPEPDQVIASNITRRHYMADSAKTYLDLFDRLVADQKAITRNAVFAPIVDAPAMPRGIAGQSR